MPAKDRWPLSIFRVRFCHQPVDLFLGLNDGAHMMMERQLHALDFGNLAQTVQTDGKFLPLFLVHHVLTALNGLIQSALNAVALLGYTDAGCANFQEEVALPDESFFGFFVGSTDQEGRKPLIADGHTPQIQGLL